MVCYACDRFEIRLPPALGVHESLALSGDLAGLPQAETYVFNFKEWQFGEPFGLLVASEAIHRFRNAHPKSKFLAIGYEHCGYAAHMGFFRRFGMNFGKS